MPVNKDIGNLWFKTQQEIDQYDKKMVANIELKEDDFDKPTFTILATRAKKEHFFEYNEKAKKTMEQYE